MSRNYYLKTVGEICGRESKRKTYLTRKTKTLLNAWALEAYRLDPTKPLIYYYEMFLKHLRKKYCESVNKQSFFENGVLEV